LNDAASARLAQLEQQINHIISNSSDSEAVLQIAQTLGEAFRVDYCLVMVAADEQFAGQIYTGILTNI